MVGQAEIAWIMCFRPSSMRLAISISPSRVSSSTEPISRMYMRTGSVVRPNSESTVDSAASASSSTSSSGDAAAGASRGDQQRFRVRRLVVDLDAHVAERGDDRLDLLRVHQVVGQVVVDLGVGEEAALLAELDQVLQARAPRLGVFLGQLGRDQPGVLLAPCGPARPFALRLRPSATLGLEQLERRLGALDARASCLVLGLAARPWPMGFAAALPAAPWPCGAGFLARTFFSGFLARFGFLAARAWPGAPASSSTP